MRRLKQLVCAFFRLGKPLRHGRRASNGTGARERVGRAGTRIRGGVPGDAAPARRSRCPVQVRHDRDQDRRLRRAISALERMLLVNPDLPRVRLELAVLYYRLGSFEVVAHLPGDRALHPPSRRKCAPGRAVSRRGREAQRSLALRGRGLRRRALSVQRQPRSADLARPPVRPDRPTSTGRPSAPPTGASVARCRSATSRISAVRTSRRSRPSSPVMPTASSSFRPPTCRSWT